MKRTDCRSGPTCPPENGSTVLLKWNRMKRNINVILSHTVHEAPTVPLTFNSAYLWTVKLKVVTCSMSHTVPALKCHTHTGHSNVHRQEAAFQRHSTHPWTNTSTDTVIPCLQQEQVLLPISTLGPSLCCDSLHGDLSVLWPVVLLHSLQTLHWTANTTHKVQQRTVYTIAWVLLLQIPYGWEYWWSKYLAISPPNGKDKCWRNLNLAVKVVG